MSIGAGAKLLHLADEGRGHINLYFSFGRVMANPVCFDC